MVQPDPRFVGKQLPESRFAGDDGTVDPVVERALVPAPDGAVDLYALERALVGTRLLIPTAASADDVELDQRTGHHIEKTSHLSVVTFESSAGWKGLLAFTSVEAAARWDPAARPVPVSAAEAAAAALEDGRTVLVLDLAGPHRVSLSGTLLRALSMNREAVRPLDDEDVSAAIDATVVPMPGVAAWSAIPSDDADLAVVLTMAAGHEPLQVAQQVATALAADPLIRDRCERGIAIGITGAAAQ